MSTTPSVRRNAGAFLFSHPAHLLAQGFGSGLSPIMPGTAGTLLGWALYALPTMRWPQFFTAQHWAVIVAIGFLIGVWACERTGRDIGAPDHGSMVWDEIIAFWLVLLLLMPASFSTQCWAFFWFRVFDMVKPPPIRHFDEHLVGGFGVMWDDIVAAFYTLLLFALWRLF
jgi:phosphatidylglycerophosphatase A